MDNSDLIYELRVGNIVKCSISNDAGIYTVVVIDGMNHKVMLNGARHGEWIDIRKIKPIKLTNEFILKIDDVSGDFDKFFKKVSPSFTLSKNTNKFGGVWNYIDCNKNIVCQINYLHELQNIYIDQHKESLPIELKRY
jgi:hypothetical protein